MIFASMSFDLYRSSFILNFYIGIPPAMVTAQSFLIFKDLLLFRNSFSARLGVLYLP